MSLNNHSGDGTKKYIKGAGGNRNSKEPRDQEGNRSGREGDLEGNIFCYRKDESKDMSGVTARYTDKIMWLCMWDITDN